MHSRKGYLLFMVNGGMEFCWLYAWAAFLMTSLFHRPFPFVEADVIFALAWAITFLSKGRGWRIIHILGLQVFGFLSAALRLIYIFYSFPHPFFGQTWLLEFYGSPKTPLDWLVLVFLLFWALLFWAGGVALAGRAMAYPAFCARFDWGLSAFFVLFLTSFLLLVKGEIEINAPLSYLLLFPFFLLSLLSIGLTRVRDTASKDFLPGYQGIGVILSFTFTVFLWGTGLVLFFLPCLTLASKVGADLLRVAAKPVGFVLLTILRYIFFRNGNHVNAPPSSSGRDGVGDLPIPDEGGWWPELIGKVLAWGFGGLIGLTVLTLSVLAIVYLFRWLSSRTPVDRRRQGPWDLLLTWTLRLKSLFVAIRRKIIQRAKGYRQASRLYNALLCWGYRSGLPQALGETPAEYGMRLKHRFPMLYREIDGIIDAFHLEVYGERVLSEQQLVSAKSYWYRLCSPFLWPSRLKTRYFLHSD